MSLQHIQDAVCRHCGAACVGETWHGPPEAHEIERRDFGCGADSVWHGIDNSVRESCGCWASPARREAVKRAEAALEHVRNVVAEHVLDLPERTRQDILGGVAHAEHNLKRAL